MKIRVAFWAGLGGQSPTQGNVRAFQHFGIVEYIPCGKVKARQLNKGADLFFTPDIRLIQEKDPEIFTILQMGGRGPTEHWKMGIFDNLYNVTKHAEVVTMLDTNLYHFLLKQNQPWDWSSVFLVPNGMHYDMFQPPQKRVPAAESRKFTVLMGKVEAIGKLGYDIAKVAVKIKELGYEDRIQIVAPIQTAYIASQDWIPLEPRPFYKMPQLYQEADVFLNVPEREVLPNTVFEAYQTGLPVVVSKGSSIARIQTVPLKYLDEMRGDFGMSVDCFDEKWKPHYEEGTHYLQGETIEDIAEKIVMLYENPDVRRKLGEQAREWALRLNWRFYDKCKLLLELAHKAGLEVNSDGNALE